VGNFTATRITRLAAQALSEGRGDGVYDFWCELAETLLVLAVQARGWHMQVPAFEEEAWLMNVDGASPCAALCNMCELLQTKEPPRAIPARAALAWSLPEFARLTSDDVLGAVCGELARATLSRASWSPDTVTATTSSLLGAICAIGDELEQAAATWPRLTIRAALERDSVLRKSEGQVLAMQLPGDARAPEPGVADRVIEHCLLLAAGRLFEGERVESRFKRVHVTDSQFRYLMISAKRDMVQATIKTGKPYGATAHRVPRTSAPFEGCRLFVAADGCSGIAIGRQENIDALQFIFGSPYGEKGHLEKLVEFAIQQGANRVTALDPQQALWLSQYGFHAVARLRFQSLDHPPPDWVTTEYQSELCPDGYPDMIYMIRA
jgi:hypothetical protein